MNKEDQIKYGLIGVKSAKNAVIVSHENEGKRKHEEAELHLRFCRWVRKNYPDLKFIRHEKERARSYHLGNLMKDYNSLDGIPDFELVSCIMAPIDIHRNTILYGGFYIEFKKPGEYWIGKDGFVKPEYEHQYKCHVKLWKEGRCAYFCNNFEDAKMLLRSYLSGNPVSQQVYKLRPDQAQADRFFDDYDNGRF